MELVNKLGISESLATKIVTFLESGSSIPVYILNQIPGSSSLINIILAAARAMIKLVGRDKVIAF
ncbi:MAG: uberolysin/carnocyclin family circular bacteriocin [Clostridiaceae bacterium]